MKIKIAILIYLILGIIFCIRAYSDEFINDLMQELNMKYDCTYKNCSIVSNYACKRLQDQQYEYVNNIGVHRPNAPKGHRIVVFADRFGKLYMITTPWDYSQPARIILKEVNGNHLQDACKMIYPNWDEIVHYDRYGNKLRYYERKRF